LGGFEDTLLCEGGRDYIHDVCVLSFKIEYRKKPQHTYLGSFVFDPKDVRSLSLRPVQNFIQGTGLPLLGHPSKGHQDPVKAYRHQNCEGLNPIIH